MARSLHKLPAEVHSLELTRGSRRVLFKDSFVRGTVAHVFPLFYWGRGGFFYSLGAVARTDHSGPIHGGSDKLTYAV